MRLSLSRRGAFLSALPVSVALAFTAGCPEPPADPKKPSLVLEAAKKHTVTLDYPAPGLPVTRENYISLAVKLDAKAPWQALFEFLLDLQSSERFIALESCELKMNREDKTQLRASLSVAQWFAPK